MSTSYSSNLIVGIKLSDIYQCQDETVDKTKYNQDTGEPYTVKVKRLCATFGNKVLPPVEYTTPKYSTRTEADQDWDFLPHGIEVHGQSDFGDPYYVREKSIVGIHLVENDFYEGSELSSVSLEEITQAIDRVKKVLSGFGYDGPVSVFAQTQAH